MDGPLPKNSIDALNQKNFMGNPTISFMNDPKLNFYYGPEIFFINGPYKAVSRMSLNKKIWIVHNNIFSCMAPKFVDEWPQPQKSYALL